jgi:hypothetical protein
MNRSPRTITKYRFCFKLVLNLAERRGVLRIDQIDLAFVDAFQLQRIKHTAQRRKMDEDEGSESQDNSQ